MTALTMLSNLNRALNIFQLEFATGEHDQPVDAFRVEHLGGFELLKEFAPA